MTTLLVTSKMNPQLAARVERSVRGRQGKSMIVRRIVSVARLALVVTIAFAIYSFVRNRQEERRELEAARAALLETVRLEGESLSASDRDVVARAEPWIIALSGGFEGELVAPPLRQPGALAQTLARPLLYIRGAQDVLTTPPAIASAALSSTKDALVLCLLDPPASRSEKALLEKVRVAYLGGAAMAERTENVYRLGDAVKGLPLLGPEWADRVRSAPDSVEVARLRVELDKAPIQRTKRAAKAQLLLVVVDEPGDGKGPTELDGERPHAIRIALVDLAASKVLLRTRKDVDPAWISTAKRPTYASGLDACAFAFDVQRGLGHSD